MSSFCKALNEYPVYKVVAGSQTLVFVGKNVDFWDIWNSKKSKVLKHKALVDTFGSGAKNRFALDTEGAVYVDKMIFHDDTVRTVLARVSDHLGKPVGLTCHVATSVDHFLINMFRDKQVINGQDLATGYLAATGTALTASSPIDNMVNKRDARRLCKRLDRVIVNISYHLVDGVYTTYSSTKVQVHGTETINTTDDTLESFGAMGNTLYVTGQTDIVAMVVSKDKLATNDAMMSAILQYKPSSENVRCQPNFVHYRVNKMEPGTLLNMFKLFSDLVAIVDTPFMKWISATKTIFKVHTSFTHNRALLGSWTRVENTKYVKANNEIIVLKVVVEKGLIATVVIFSNGMYDIKMNFRASQVTTPRIIDQYVANVATQIKILLPGFPEMDKADAAFKIIASGVIEDNRKVVSDSQLQKAVEEHLSPIFTVMSNSGGILTMVFKRGRGFQNEDNAMKFLSQHFSLAKAELVTKISDMFGLEVDDANKVYKQWKAATKLGDGKTFVKFRSLKLILVKVKCTKLNYKYVIDGATDVMQLRRITNAICYALSKGRSVVGKGNKIKNIEEQNAVADDEFDFDIDLSDFGLDKDAFQDEFFNEDGGEEKDGVNADADADADVGDASVMEMKRRMICPKVAGGDAWLHKYVLNKLYEADRDLFSFKEGNKPYAKTCQKVSMRQPIVTSKMELDYNEKCFPGSITGSVNYGTTEELAHKNNYWCPKVWCPKSRVGLTLEQFKGEYRGKCPFPGVDETPIIFEHKDYWKGKPRQIGYLSPTEHPNQFCMPCCFVKKLSEKNNKCVQTVGNDRYIKTESYPVEEKRYGLLPEILGAFFGNTFCGGKDGGQGLMNENTDCFLRYGIPLNNQSFLQAMVHSLDNDKLVTVDDMVNAIVKNVDMGFFLSCHDGLLCKRFLGRGSIANINNLRDFNDFKTWFMSSKNSDYIDRFNLGALVATLKHVRNFEPKLKYAKYIVREFRLFNALKAFREYISDPNVKKTHDVLLQLVQIRQINVNGYNLIVIEEGPDPGSYSIACPIFSEAKASFNKERPIIILLRQGAYYEPIHYVKNNAAADKKKGIVGIEKKHRMSDNEAVSKIAQLYLTSCIGPGQTAAEKIKSTLGSRIICQLLNFDLHVVAFYTSDHIVIPLHVPIPMDPSHASGFMFLDTFLKTFKYEIDVADVKKVLKDINSFVGSDYFVVQGALKAVGRKVALKIKDCYVFIPLTHYDSIKQSDVYKDVIRDGAIFIGHEKNDPRKDFIDKTKYVDALFVFLWNEIVTLAKRQEDVMQLVETSRHIANPIPKSFRRVELLNAISKLLPRVVFKGREDFAKVLGSRICSTISKKGDCINQCTYVANMNDKGERVGAHCKLSVPRTFYDVLLEKCVEDLLNPLITVDVRSVVADVASQSVLVFSDQDIKKEGGIDNILTRGNAFGTFDFEPMRIPIPASFHKIQVDEGMDKKYITQETIPLPTFLVSVLKEFSLHVLGSSDTLVDLFHTICNKVHPDAMLSLEQVAHFWKTDADGNVFDKLDELCKSIKVNCILVSRKSVHNPDRVRCMGKQGSLDFYVLLNMTMDGKREVFQIYVKNNKKYLLTRSDFPEDFGKVVQNKCIIRNLSVSSQT